MLFLLQTALADCPSGERRTTLELTENLEEAESSYREADVDRFFAGAKTMDAVLPCVSEVVPRSLIARLHRTFGLRAFVERDQDRARAAFSGAKGIEPDYVFPTEMIPPQHPMAALYGEPLPVSASTPLVRPDKGFIMMDGRRAEARVDGQAVLFQRVVQDLVLETRYLWPADPTPTYAHWVEPLAVASPTPLPAPPGKARTSRTLLVVAGATAIAAGGVYAAAGASRSSYQKAELERKDALRSQTNTLAYAGAGLGVVAVGLGVSAVVVGRW